MTAARGACPRARALTVANTRRRLAAAALQEARTSAERSERATSPSSGVGGLRCDASSSLSWNPAAVASFAGVLLLLLALCLESAWPLALLSALALVAGGRAVVCSNRSEEGSDPVVEIPWIPQHRRPEFTVPPPEVAFDSPEWGLWEDRLVAEASKGKGVVAMYNMGLHFHADEAYNQTLTHIFKALERVTRTPPAEKRSRNVAMFMETTSQHFPTKTGGYYAEVLEERGETPIHDYTCVPAERHGYSCQLHSEWRNRVAEAIGRLFPDVPIAPMGDLTEDMWDMHPHSKDCTHWCYAPALVEAVAYLILHIVEAVDEGKGRHELDWALHARHRG